MKIIGIVSDERFRYQLHEMTVEFFKPESIEIQVGGLPHLACNDEETDQNDEEDILLRDSDDRIICPDGYDLIIKVDIEELEEDFRFSVELKGKKDSSLAAQNNVGVAQNDSYAVRTDNKMICQFDNGTDGCAVCCLMTELPVFLSNKELPVLNRGRKALRALLYDIFCEISGKSLPWGSMIGVRPAKTVNMLFEEGYSEEEIFQELTQKYHASQEKSELAINVAKNQSRMLAQTDKNEISIYIGIPFCPTRCLYCSFTSNPIKKYENLVDEYIDVLIEEMEATKGIVKDKEYKIKSVYIGGGTPTSISAEQLDKLLDAVDRIWGQSHMLEFCVEAGRPDSITRKKLEVLKKYNVTRICINPQTLNNETLERIGRRHTAETFFKAFELSREIGFDNINIDVIAGLPGEDFLMFKNTLDGVLELEPENITVHTMSLKRASDLNRDKDEYIMTAAEEVNKMVSYAYKNIVSCGLSPSYMYRQKNMLGNLENVSYSKEGYNSYYNIHIMEEDMNILAFGAGGATKIVDEVKIERFFNAKDVEGYIKRKDEIVDKKKKFIYNNLVSL